MLRQIQPMFVFNAQPFQYPRLIVVYSSSFIFSYLIVEGGRCAIDGAKSAINQPWLFALAARAIGTRCLLLLTLLYPRQISFETYLGGGRFRVLKAKNRGQTMREPSESDYSAICLQTSDL